jgi:hypothetical protein
MTVAGFTIARTSTQREYTRDTTTQNARPTTDLQDSELLAQHKVLGDQVRSGAECGEQGSDIASRRASTALTFPQLADAVSGQSVGRNRYPPPPAPSRSLMNPCETTSPPPQPSSYDAHASVIEGIDYFAESTSRWSSTTSLPPDHRRRRHQRRTAGVVAHAGGGHMDALARSSAPPVLTLRS